MKQLWLLFVFVSLVLSVVPLIKRDWNEKYGIDWTGTYEDLHRCLDPSQMNETILEVLADEFERRMTPGNTFEGYDIVDAEFKVIRIRAVKSEYLKKSVTILPRIFRLQYDLQVISTEVGPHNATIHTNHDVTLIRTLGGYHITRHLKSKLETEVVSPQTLDGTFIQHNAFESPEIVDHAKETKQVNLMTYNIWNLNSPWNNRKDLIVQDVREINPDVIAWQEIRYHHKMREKNSIHQISDLMHNFPEHNFVFESGATYIDTYDSRTYNQYEDEGVAISSRFPILESSYTRFLRNFSDHEDEHQRLCLRALVETPIGKINYFTSHFSLSENARLRNLVEFVEFSDRFSMPQVFVGDFNEIPDADTIRFLEGNLGKEWGKIGNWKDAWKILRTNEDPDAWTYTTLEAMPKKRIDFIMYRGDIEPKSIGTTKAHQTHLKPSDHRGVFAVFESIRK